MGLKFRLNLSDVEVVEETRALTNDYAEDEDSERMAK